MKPRKVIPFDPLGEWTEEVDMGPHLKDEETGLQIPVRIAKDRRARAAYIQTLLSDSGDSMQA